MASFKTSPEFNASRKLDPFLHLTVELVSLRDEETQIALLKIIHGLLEKLSLRDLEYVMPSITAMWTNPSTACRDLMYDILIWLYDTYR